jgi:hypothetical protein
MELAVKIFLLGKFPLGINSGRKKSFSLFLFSTALIPSQVQS